MGPAVDSPGSDATSSPSMLHLNDNKSKLANRQTRGHEKYYVVAFDISSLPLPGVYRISAEDKFDNNDDDTERDNNV